MRPRKPPQVRNPHGLPTKLCAACGKPFTWRKKWERDWDQVRYCSDRCRQTGPRTAPPDGHSPG